MKTMVVIMASMIIVIVFQAAEARGIDVDGFDTRSTAQGSAVLVPEDESKHKRPALILLPFTGGSAQDLFRRFYRDTLAEQAREMGLVIVMPEPTGSAQDYASGSAWTATLDRYTRDVGADAQELVTRFDVDPARIALAGYSMGGDLGWALIQRHPERYAGAIVMGSRASYRSRNGLEQLARRNGRVYMFLGGDENEARRAGTHSAVEAAKRAGVQVRLAIAAGGHVAAPPDRFSEAVSFVLGAVGTARPASTDAPAIPPARAATSRDIVARLPSCDWESYEDEDSGKSGYKNARGKITVPARFDFAESFRSDGLAGIHENGNFGYINCEGKTFSVIAFDNGPDRFRQDLARFSESGRIGYVNRRGEVVIPAQFESAGPFCDGLAEAGSHCHKEEMGEYTMSRCSTEFYIDRSGKRVPTPADPPFCDDY